MTDFGDLVPALKREIAEPGQFDTYFPGVTDAALVGWLLDAFGQAQLEGYFGTSIFNLDTETVTPDLTPGGQAFIVMIAGERILTNRILNMRSKASYQAGPVKYETENAASVMTQVLKQLQARRDRITLVMTTTGTYVCDQYSDRLAAEWGYGSDGYGTVGGYGLNGGYGTDTYGTGAY